MPVNIERVTSEVTVLEGEMPLSPRQIDKLVQMVLECLETRQRERSRSREATTVRREAAPPMHIAE